jgi:formylglycine-generating enzyme required for sulfatase activity
MSPEQAAGLPLDARSDVYAIGAMVYELLTGLRPYTDETTSASRDEVLQLVRSQPPRPVETVAKGVPGELAAIVQRAMARQRDDRYPSVTALAADLRAFLDRRVVQAYRTGPLVELSMWIRRNRPLAASLVAAVLLLCGGVFGVTSYAAEVGAWQRRDEVSRQQFKILEAEPVTNVQFDQLAELTSLVAQCEAFPNEVIDALRRDAFLGPRYHLPWGLQRRLDAVRELHALQQARGEAAWRRVQRELAEDRRFDGYRIEPDVDLVPLRRDAESGLQWFWHPPTGSEPHFGADGRIEWHEANGLVFVLLPPGEYLRGSDLPPDNAKPTPEESRRLAESWAKYAMADDNDTQPFRVTVRPFYLCVTELTQVHWLRITGDNPSSCAIGDRPHPHRPEQHITGLHPVESVDALSARRALSMFGLVLPSETQWEYAYRAGTTTRWFTGQDPHSLFDASTTPPRGFANIADGSRFDLESTRMLRNELAPYDDGYPVHAPIDAFAPNAFGLLGMAGNVFEWCEDVYDPMAHLLPPNDEPARHGNKPRFRTVRGGGWKSPAREASAADRWGRAEFLGTSDCGVRPAKAARWQ